jgi:hypothetical protein
MAPCRSPDAARAMPLAVPGTVPGGIRGAWHGTRVRCRHPGFRPATSAPVQPSARGLHPGYLGTALSPITKIARASLCPPFCRFVPFMFPESTAITRAGSGNLYFDRLRPNGVFAASTEVSRVHEVIGPRPPIVQSSRRNTVGCTARTVRGWKVSKAWLAGCYVRTGGWVPA